MKHLFYFMGIVFIIYELGWLLNLKDNIDKSKKLRKETKKNKGKKWDDMTDKYKNLLKTRGLASLIFSSWMFAGLLTFNWVAFMIMIMFNFVVIAPISKLTQYNWAYSCLHWINSLLGFVFGIFVIVNSYHLKINLYEWLMGLLNK